MSADASEPMHRRVVFGTSSLGAGAAVGSVEEQAAIRTATAMLQRDVLIDTSNNYAGGRSEQVLGAALADLDGDVRAAAAERIITKVDRDPDTGVFDGDRVRRSVEESLTRLGLDRVPLLHLHDSYIVPFAESMASGGAVEALVELREAGVVDRIGIAAGPVPFVRRYVDTGVFDAVLCHNRFTLVDDTAASLFAAARDRGMTVFNAAPYGGDLLVRGSRPGASYCYRPASAELLSWTTALERTCTEFDVRIADAALHFSLRSPLVDATVVGISSPARIDALLASAEHPPPEEFWTAIRSLAPAPSPVDDSAYDGEAP